MSAAHCGLDRGEPGEETLGGGDRELVWRPNSRFPMETAFQIFRCLYASGLLMKRFILFFALLSLPVFAEETTLPAPAQPSAQPEAAPSPASAPAVPESQPAALDQPISLIPEALPEPSKKPGSNDSSYRESDKKAKKFKDDSRVSPVDLSADELKKRIRFREVKNKALVDDRIQADMEIAQAAKTDKEKREALKSYYTKLFDKMLKLDPLLKPEIEARRKTYLARYDQNRVRAAGEPLEFDSEDH